MEVEEGGGGEGGPKSTVVEKQLQVDLDLGHLLVSDNNQLNVAKLKTNPNAYLKSLARENTQLLINEIWKLPFERVDDVVVAKLPKPTYILPREKTAPKPKPMTKWEQYAKDKGISKKKKGNLVWDEMVKKWVPRYGYKRAEVEQEKDWLLEVPGNADPMEDQFEKKAELKAERVSKNELQRLRNLAKAKKVQIPKAGLTPKDKPSKIELHQAVHVAKKATASLGKFQAKLPKEKPLKGTGKKRKFDPVVMDPAKEKEKNLDLLSKVMNKKPKMDIGVAVNKQIQMRDTEQFALRDKESRQSKGRAGKGPKRKEGKRRGGAPAKVGKGGGSRGRGKPNRKAGGRNKRA